MGEGGRQREGSPAQRAANPASLPLPLEKSAGEAEREGRSQDRAVGQGAVGPERAPQSTPPAQKDLTGSSGEEKPLAFWEHG